MRSWLSGDTMSLAAGLYDITNETLGKGHFAVVKLARHCLSSELVAVKIVDKTKLTAESLQQHNLEVKLLSRLSEHEHPNIVRLYQVINTKSKLYLVMEYCGRDVCDLYDYIQKRNNGGGLRESEAKHIFRQICSAIAYCHSLRIVHRDLKPENLLIVNQSSNEDVESTINQNNNNIESEEGLPLTSNPPEMPTSQSAVIADNVSDSTTTSTSASAADASISTTGSGSSNRPSLPNYKYPIVKLIDFGFANQWQEGVKLGTSCGSLAYSAPEILLGGRYDGDKVDVWGLGCILYILLYGTNPFMQMNDNETLVRIIDCSFKTPDRSNVSATAIKLIRSVLIKDPSQRLTVAQVMSDTWFDGMESDPMFQVPSTRTTALTSSGPSHTPTPPSSPPAPFSQATQNQPAIGPNGDAVVVSESKENISPVLIPSSSVNVQLRSKSPSTVNDVHDRVIREMIAHKKELTKERVERALRLARRPGSSLPAVVESAPLVLDPTTVKVGNVRMDDDDSYITATYNLLKDKILKELQGIPISSSNTHEIASKSHQKKGHVLQGRRRGAGVSQAPRFGRPGRPLDDISLKKQLLEEQESTTVVVSEEEQDFRLPLQRKCSIVSEEGSCELSGRLSETGSDILSHTILLGDGVEPIIQRRSIPVVDIVITDHDHEQGSADMATDAIDGTCQQKDEVIEDLSEEIDLRTCTEDRFEEEEDEFDAQASKDRDIPPDTMDRMVAAAESSSSTTPAKIKNLLETSSKNERIHVVSSSPDLSKMLEEDEENRLEFVTDVLRYDAAAHITGKRPVTMFIDDPPCIKGHVIDDVADHVSRHQKRRDSKPIDTSAASSADPADTKQTGQSITGTRNPSASSAEKSAPDAAPSAKGTSVRVITQSKSCNNIVYNDKERDGENNVHRKGSGKTAAGSGDSKGRNKDRNDCCLIG